MSPVFDTFLAAWSPAERNPKFAANFEYLQVEFDGHKAYMALGRREVVNGKLHEYWYSAQREMMMLSNGRIEQVFGMTRELRQVNGEQPTWLSLLKQDHPVVWKRRLDLMPGYRYGVTEIVTGYRTNRPGHAPGDVAASATWIHETVKRQEPDDQISTYTQWFAIQEGNVVYSEQCLAAQMCFKLMPLGFKGS